MVTQTGIYYLPFNIDWGYPQIQRIVIPDSMRVFDIAYFWNRHGYVVMRVTDLERDEIVFTAQLNEWMQEEIRDPETNWPWFWIIPVNLSPGGCKIRVFWTGMYTN